MRSLLQAKVVLIQISVNPIQEIGPEVGGGHSFVSGCFFARVR